MDKKIWLRSWGELAGHVRWGKMDHKPQRKRYPRISPAKQTNSQSTNSRSDHLSTRQPKDGDRSMPCSPLPPSRANSAGTKSSPMHLLLPEHPLFCPGKSTHPGLEMPTAPSSQYLVKNPCFPEPHKTSLLSHHYGWATNRVLSFHGI